MKKILIAIVLLVSVCAAPAAYSPSPLALSGADREFLIADLREQAQYVEYWADVFFRKEAERAYILGVAEGYRQAAQRVEDYGLPNN